MELMRVGRAVYFVEAPDCFTVSVPHGSCGPLDIFAHFRESASAPAPFVSVKCLAEIHVEFCDFLGRERVFDGLGFDFWFDGCHGVMWLLVFISRRLPPLAERQRSV